MVSSLEQKNVNYFEILPSEIRGEIFGRLHNKDQLQLTPVNHLFNREIPSRWHTEKSTAPERRRYNNIVEFHPTKSDRCWYELMIMGRKPASWLEYTKKITWRLMDNERFRFALYMPLAFSGSLAATFAVFALASAAFSGFAICAGASLALYAGAFGVVDVCEKKRKFFENFLHVNKENLVILVPNDHDDKKASQKHYYRLEQTEKRKQRWLILRPCDYLAFKKAFAASQVS